MLSNLTQTKELRKVEKKCWTIDQPPADQMQPVEYPATWVCKRQTQNKDLDRSSSSQRITKITDKSNPVNNTNSPFIFWMTHRGKLSLWIFGGCFENCYSGPFICKLMYPTTFLQIVAHVVSYKFIKHCRCSSCHNSLKDITPSTPNNLLRSTFVHPNSIPKHAMTIYQSKKTHCIWLGVW